MREAHCMDTRCGQVRTTEDVCEVRVGDYIFYVDDPGRVSNEEDLAREIKDHADSILSLVVGEDLSHYLSLRVAMAVNAACMDEGNIESIEAALRAANRAAVRGAKVTNLRTAESDLVDALRSIDFEGDACGKSDDAVREIRRIITNYLGEG